MKNNKATEKNKVNIYLKFSKNILNILNNY